MKKAIILGAFALFAMTSCKKDFTCACKGNVSPQSNYTINNQKESEAEKACDDYETAAKVGDSTVGCELQES